MSENLQTPVSKGKKLRGGSRTGAGRKPLPTHQKKEQFNVSLPPGDVIALKILIPSATERNELIKKWVRAYVIAGGESDRLLMQSSVAVEVLAYLESTDAPQELIDKVESAIVARVVDDAKIAERVSQVGESFVI